MSVLKENDDVRKLLRSDIWAKAGYTGKGKVVVILDGSDGKPYKDMESYYTDVFGTAKEQGHPTKVAFTIHEFAYDSKILYFNYTRNKDKVYEWLKTHKDEINFINVSMVGILGKETPEYLRIMELGIPLICAVGNDDSEKWISYPARYEENVAVGATDRDGENVKDYSNEGLGIDTVVPSGIYIRRDDGYIWANNGTSFSSPTVVGLYCQYDQWRTDNGLDKMTQDEAEELSHILSEDIEDEGYDIKSGYGIWKLPLEIPVISKPTEPKEPEIIINPPSPTPEKEKDDSVNNGDDKMPIKYKVALNAGHGVKNDGTIDVGAVGATGYKEYIETKEIVDLINTKLKFNGIETLVIQDGDLWDVTNQANAWKADYFISIHTNSFSTDSHGVETFSLAITGKGRQLSESIHKELVPATGLYDRGLKTANYHVLRETNMPACLTEIGFISNPKEEVLMKDPLWDSKVATAIALGICNFLGISYLESTSPLSPTPTPSSNVLFRIIMDNQQVMALSNQDSAIAKVKELVNNGSGQKGIVQRTDGVNVFEYSKQEKIKGKIIFYIYDDDARVAKYYSDYLGNVKAVDVKDMTSDMWNYEEIIQIGGSKYNSNVTLVLSGNDAFLTIVETLKHMWNVK